MLVLFLILILSNIIPSARADDDSFSDFLDGIGNSLEGLDFSFGSSSNSDDNYYSSGTHHHHHYYRNNWLDTYLHIRLIDNLFEQPTAKRTTIDPLLSYPIIFIITTTCAFMFIWPVLDCYKTRSFRGKRIANTFCLGLFGIIGWFLFYVGCHLIKLLYFVIPYFLLYVLGIVFVLYLIFLISRKRTRQSHDYDYDV